MSTDRIETPDEVLIWIAGHQVAYAKDLDAQSRFNDAANRQLEALGLRQLGLERRFLYVAAFASGIGAFVGVIASGAILVSRFPALTGG